MTIYKEFKSEDQADKLFDDNYLVWFDELQQTKAGRNLSVFSQWIWR